MRLIYFKAACIHRNHVGKSIGYSSRQDFLFSTLFLIINVFIRKNLLVKKVAWKNRN